MIPHRRDDIRRCSQANRPVTHPPVGRGVIGILRRGDRYLMIRRSPIVRKGGYWCFPGGHVERGEAPHRAIQREFMEELGVRVIPEQRLGSIRIPDGNYILAVWMVRECGGVWRPDQREIAETRWLTLPQIRTVEPGLPSNQTVLAMLQR